MAPESEYIDDYFNNILSAEDRIAFEQRCLADEGFAEEVALYIASREGVQRQLNEERKKRWKNLQHAEAAKPAKVINLKKWAMVAAAACIAAIVFVLWPSGKSNLQEASEKYIAQNLQTISVSMGSGEDSLQQAIDFYNRKEYEKAIDIFSELIRKSSAEAYALQPQGADVAMGRRDLKDIDIYAVQYRGLSYLMLKKYDAAIEDFGTLSNYPGLTVNPGVFYKAITLLQRNQPDDATSARKLLQHVIDGKLEGWKKAEEWLK